MGRRSEMTPRQRNELVLRLLRREEPGVRLARQAEVSEQALYRWRDDFISGGQGALNGKGSESGLQAELKRKEEQLAECVFLVI